MSLRVEIWQVLGGGGALFLFEAREPYSLGSRQSTGRLVQPLPVGGDGARPAEGSCPPRVTEPCGCRSLLQGKCADGWAVPRDLPAPRSPARGEWDPRGTRASCPWVPGDPPGTGRVFGSLRLLPSLAPSEGVPGSPPPPEVAPSPPCPALSLSPGGVGPRLPDELEDSHPWCGHFLCSLRGCLNVLGGRSKVPPTWWPQAGQIFAHCCNLEVGIKVWAGPTFPKGSRGQSLQLLAAPGVPGLVAAWLRGPPPSPRVCVSPFARGRP